MTTLNVWYCATIYPIKKTKKNYVQTLLDFNTVNCCMGLNDTDYGEICGATTLTASLLLFPRLNRERRDLCGASFLLTFGEKHPDLPDSTLKELYIQTSISTKKLRTACSARSKALPPWGPFYLFIPVHLLGISVLLRSESVQITWPARRTCWAPVCCWSVGSSSSQRRTTASSTSLLGTRRCGRSPRPLKRLKLDRKKRGRGRGGGCRINHKL